MRRSPGLVAVIGWVVPLALGATARPARAFDAVLSANQDTFINSAAADNNDGASPSLYTGHNGMGGTMRALVRFAIPSDWKGRVMVTRAVLAAITRGTGNAETTVPTAATEALQAVTTAWTEGTGFGDMTTMNTVGQACGTSGATWNQPNCAGGTPWSGGSVAATVSGAASAPAMIEATVTWDSATDGNAGMLADVQGWIDVPGANQGWRLSSSTEDATSGEAQRFYSREVAGKGPTLTVTATCRAGFVEVDGGCTAGSGAPDGGMPDGGGSIDSGTPPVQRSSDSGCSCSLAASERQGPRGLLAASATFIAALAAARRRRRAARLSGT
ncbi:MAG TPA: DNRLRE domain-containing protein [Polyangia bacterium]|nr:DNRLRE domain-containing protein [Polyangia bacterium]